MDITCYLPDEIGERAKEADLPFSRLLRSAVEHELHRRAAIVETLKGLRTWEVGVEDDEGRNYTGRIEGAMIAWDGDVRVYLSDDERVLLHDGRKSAIHEIHEPVEELRDWLDDESYIEAMHMLGLRPVVDL